MAKIRTVEELDQEIDEETKWRKRELTTSLSLIKEQPGPAQKSNIRSAILFLYAHWEGWVKEVSRLYIRYVNTKSLPYESLSTAFLGNALKTKIAEIDKASTARAHSDFAAFLRTSLSQKSTLSEDLIKTESNLTSSVFFEIVERLGLEKRDSYQKRAPEIDQKLVGWRNTVAHGEYLGPRLEDFIGLRTRTLDTLELFTDDVRNAASTGAHLAKNQGSPNC